MFGLDQAQQVDFVGWEVTTVGLTILVGLGGSGGSGALAWATDEAAATGGRLVVCHACGPDSPLAVPTPTPAHGALELFDPALARAVATTRARLGGDRVALRVPMGRPGPVLVAAAAQADLAVLGSPGRHLPGGYGSTTHHVAAHAPCPVVAVRPIAAGRDAPLRGHVVVGVDGSNDAGTALEFAFGWADQHHGVLAAVHVTTGRREDYWFDQTTLSTHFAHEPAGLELLARAVEPWLIKYPRLPVKCAVYAGHPLPGLLRAARGARLLVVGGRGTGWFRSAGLGRLGGATHGLLDDATGPVAVVRGSSVPAFMVHPMARR
jgi:nucleotide-binding universal stress UspA family protein